MALAPIETAIDAVGRGEIVVVIDDEDRGAEGDLIMAASAATPEAMAFISRHSAGGLYAALTEARADALDLPWTPAPAPPSAPLPLTVTVDYRYGTTSGSSAVDRAATVRALIDPGTRPSDLARPGHLQVRCAREGGVLERADPAEAAVDLARLAGAGAAGVLGEVVAAPGLSATQRPQLQRLAEEHGLVMISIADLIRYRRQRETVVHRVSDARVPTEWGEFRCVAYQNPLDGETHAAFVKGEPRGRDNVLVRVHSECLTGDVFGSLRCDCGTQLRTAMATIAAEGLGVVVYLRGHEGRGIGLAHKLQAYELQDGGLDTLDANIALGLPVDSREYGIGAQILIDLGITTMRIMTNNPAKRSGMEGFGLTVAEQIPIPPQVTPDNLPYLRTKQVRMGHVLEGLPAPAGGLTGPKGLLGSDSATSAPAATALRDDCEAI